MGALAERWRGRCSRSCATVWLHRWDNLVDSNRRWPNEDGRAVELEHLAIRDERLSVVKTTEIAASVLLFVLASGASTVGPYTGTASVLAGDRLSGTLFRRFIRGDRWNFHLNF